MDVYMLVGSGGYAGYVAQAEDANRTLMALEPPPEGRWTPPHLQEYLGDPPGKPKRIGEFHSAGRALFFSERARTLLAEQLSSCGAFRPVTIEGRPENFYRFWVTKIVDCFEPARAKMSGASPTRFGVILRPAFREEAVPVSGVFRVPGDLTGVCFATASFVRACKLAKIKGAWFVREQFDLKPIKI